MADFGLGVELEPIRAPGQDFAAVDRPRVGVARFRERYGTLVFALGIDGLADLDLNLAYRVCRGAILVHGRRREPASCVLLLHLRSAPRILAPFDGLAEVLEGAFGAREPLAYLLELRADAALPQRALQR